MMKPQQCIIVQVLKSFDKILKYFDEILMNFCSQHFVDVTRHYIVFSSVKQKVCNFSST